MFFLLSDFDLTELGEQSLVDCLLTGRMVGFQEQGVDSLDGRLIITAGIQPGKQLA